MTHPDAGLISHAAAPTEHGWLVVGVWESEEAFRQFGEALGPILRGLGVEGVRLRTCPVLNVITR
ncbi:hypothetical protein ACWC9X_27675 [Streptomyces asoensis]|uniref:hypothetical protein n=1 Tax=Streptomyces sp. MBT97 TaxID=2800411 RepID=UPI0019092439|nr:hypothetical protein [Streptomyces sp. MBT97]MBK3633485.1 hypothetical protein [Streptomyces sp. MBT97]